MDALKLLKGIKNINIGGGFCGACGNSLNPLNSFRAGNSYICKACSKKISPFFSSDTATYEDFLGHINSRDSVLDNIKDFVPNESFGENNYIYFSGEKFVISNSSNYINYGAEIFNLEDVISCEKLIDTHTAEVQYKNSKGEKKSFAPQYMAYSFDFYVVIHTRINNYSTVSVKLNTDVVDNHQPLLIDMNSSGLLDKIKDSLSSKSYEGMNTDNKLKVTNCVEYIRYNEMADKIIQRFQVTPKESVKTIRCPFCGSKILSTYRHCDNCGAPL